MTTINYATSIDTINSVCIFKFVSHYPVYSIDMIGFDKPMTNSEVKEFAKEKMPHAVSAQRQDDHEFYSAFDL